MCAIFEEIFEEIAIFTNNDEQLLNAIKSQIKTTWQLFSKNYKVEAKLFNKIIFYRLECLNKSLVLEVRSEIRLRCLKQKKDIHPVWY